MTSDRSKRPPVGQPAWSVIVGRSLIVLCPLAAVGATWLAADRTIPAVGALVTLLSLVCALHPNSHLGVLVVAVVAIQWVAIVHDHTTAWSMAAAAFVAVFHTALAAATVAPTAAPWTPTMRRRWLRRGATLVGVCAATWGLTAVADALPPGNGTILLTAALVILAAGALWVRSGHPRSGTRTG